MALKFARLARPLIRALKPNEKITEHGITAERLEDGDVRYSVNVMVDGQRIHRVVGKESEGVTRTQAETLIEGFRTKARETRLSLPKGRKTALGFSQAGDKYIERLKEEGGLNIPRKRMHLKNHLNRHSPDNLQTHGDCTQIASPLEWFFLRNGLTARFS